MRSLGPIGLWLAGVFIKPVARALGKHSLAFGAAKLLIGVSPPNGGQLLDRFRRMTLFCHRYKLTWAQNS